MNNLEDINTFYSLKKKYDNKYKKSKQIILSNNNLSLIQKKELVQKVKKYCVNCSKEGGTVFIITNKLLSASCNSVSKCKLNININKQINYNIRDEYYNIKYNYDKLKLQLVQIKNDTICNIITSEDAVELYSKYKDEYANLENKLYALLEKYSNILNNKSSNIKLINLNKNLDTQINEIRFNIDKYKEKNNDEYIKNIIDIYINYIININNDIKKLTYVYYNIECEDNSDIYCKNNNYKLVSDNYNIETLYQNNIYS